MPLKEPPFTIGIEEEYLLVDLETRELATDPPKGFMEDCEKRIEGRVSPEFLKAQVEIETSVCETVDQAEAELCELRKVISEIARDHGMAPIAASTHPLADWGRQQNTDKERYNILARDMQDVARRLVICGMHVHVGLGDDDLRIDMMSQVAYFLPHLLALSTSSPFWRGRNTGLKCYRLAVFDELPRTGLPEHFDSWGEYKRHVDTLVHAGLIEDASKLWWDIRPSHAFPTLEMRVTDICTTLKDGVAIAALYVCLLRMLWRLKRNNQRWRRYANMLIQENRWRAQRYGFDEGLVDFGKGAIGPYDGLLEELIDLTREDAEALGCAEEIKYAREILQRGTSAHRQIAAYNASLEAGDDHDAALRKVVDFLIEETVAGL